MLTLLSIAVGSPSPLCHVRPSPLPCPLQEKEQNFDIHCIAMGIICESTITSCTIATLYQCTLAHAHAWSILQFHNLQLGQMKETPLLKQLYLLHLPFCLIQQTSKVQIFKIDQSPIPLTVIYRQKDPYTTHTHIP